MTVQGSPQPPRPGERLWTYRLNREFEVSARTEGEAHQLLDQALAGGQVAGPAPVQREQVVLADGDVWGVLGWQPGPARRARSHHPVVRSRLAIGVIVWSDQGSEEPTVLVHANRATLVRAIASRMHERLSNDAAEGKLRTFLHEATSPSEWTQQDDVDNWLYSLREVTAFPAFSLHDTSALGDLDNTEPPGAAQALVRALDYREQQLSTAREREEEASTEVPRRRPSR